MEEIKAVLIELDAAYNKVEELKKKVDELSLARVKELSGLEIGDKVEVNSTKKGFSEGVGMVYKLIPAVKNYQLAVKSLLADDFKILTSYWNRYELEVNKIKKDGTMSELGIIFKGYTFDSEYFTFTKL